MLLEITWMLDGRRFSEKRAGDKPNVLSEKFKSLACREWPIYDIRVEPVKQEK